MEKIAFPKPVVSLRPNSARLFLALWPSDAVRSALRAHRDAWTWPERARLVAPPKWHITLHFIGAVPRERLPELCERLWVPLGRPFDLVFGTPGLWPRGLAVLEALETPEALSALYARLGEALRSCDLPVEPRKFRPHLTLARDAAGAQPPRVPLELRWRVTRYALVESVLGAGGGYRKLASFG